MLRWYSSQSGVAVCSPWSDNGGHETQDSDGTVNVILDGSGRIFWTWNEFRRPMFRGDMSGFPGDFNKITSVKLRLHVNTIGPGGHGNYMFFEQIDPQCFSIQALPSNAQHFDNIHCDWVEMAPPVKWTWSNLGGDVFNDFSSINSGPTTTGIWESQLNINAAVKANDSQAKLLLIRLRLLNENPFFPPGTDQNDFRENINFYGPDNATYYPQLIVDYTADMIGSGDLFISGESPSQPIEISISGDLFIHGQDRVSGSIDLFINGHDDVNASVDLFTQGHDIIIASGDLFINGQDQISNYNNLFIKGNADSSDLIYLFLGGKDDVSGVPPLSLFIYGNNTVYGSRDLLINGYTNVTTSGDIFIGGKSSIFNSGDLFINGHSDISVFVNLFIYGKDSISTYDTLFINGHDQVSDSNNLLIHGHIDASESIDISINGQDIAIASIDLFIHGLTDHNDSHDLFIDGVGFDANSCDLFTTGSGIIDFVVSLNLFINGFEQKSAAICPILDPTASIQIPDSMIAVYQSSIDGLINQLGKNVLLEFDPIIVSCPNCEYDIVNQKSIGVYAPGGPRPFARGRQCPYCKGRGIIETKSQKCIQCLIKWRPRELEDFGISVEKRDNIVRLKTYIMHMDDLLRAVSAIVSEDITALKVTRIRNPIPVGLREDRYCISFWELL